MLPVVAVATNPPSRGDGGHRSVHFSIIGIHVCTPAVVAALTGVGVSMLETIAITALGELIGSQSLVEVAPFIDSGRVEAGVSVEVKDWLPFQRSWSGIVGRSA